MGIIFSLFFGPSQTERISEIKEKQRYKKIVEAIPKLVPLNDWDKVIIETSLEIALKGAALSGRRELADGRVEELVWHLKNGTEGFSCYRVMSAFINAAIIAHETTNCLTEIMFEEAFAEAKAKDRERKAGVECKGAFWGLPCSFKDTFNVLGVDTSAGCSPTCNNPVMKPEDEAGLVKLVRMAGGIPFCKTNVPQTLLAFECANPIFGRTNHPADRSRTCGGSSGGEASLVALYGSAIGFGSDVGGSLRIPAHYSGIYAIKPVQGRLPILGSFKAVAGFDAIKTMVGPMARTVDDLLFATKSMIELAADRETFLPGEKLFRIPWKDPEDMRKLRIGYYYDTGAVKTSPACYRAVQETVEGLAKLGHIVEHFNAPNPDGALKIFAALTSADGYQTLLKNIGNDPMEPSMRLVTLGSKLPRWLHTTACWVIKNILRDRIFAEIFAVSRPKSVSEYWYWCQQRDDYAAKFNSLAWNVNSYDALISPVQAVPALEHGTTKMLSPLAVATMQFNVCDSTVGVMPVTRVIAEIDKLDSRWLDGFDGSRLLQDRVYRGKQPAYDAVKMAGLPVGIQVVGQAYEEEKVLRLMQIIEGTNNWREDTGK